MIKRKNNLWVYLSLISIDLVMIIRGYTNLTSLDFSKEVAYMVGYIGSNILQIVAVIYLSIWVYLKTKK
jgi:hypothetical protein